MSNILVNGQRYAKTAFKAKLMKISYEKGLHQGSMNILDEKNSDILSKNARNIDSKMPVSPHDPLVGKL